MTTPVTLAPTPEFKAFDNNGIPLLNGLLYTYVAGTSTPQATYIDSTGTTPNTNPVVLNARGEASVWLATALVYKLVLTDSLGNTIWTQDQIQGGVNASAITSVVTASYIGQQLYPQSAGEIAAGITPTNYQYPALTAERYGAVGDGATDDTAALTTWTLVVNALANQFALWPYGKTYYCTNLPSLTSNYFTWNAYGSTIKSKPITSYTSQIFLKGINTTVRGLTINGNQSAFASSYCTGMTVTNNGCVLEDVTITQAGANGLVFDSVTTTNTTIIGGTLSNVQLTNIGSTGYQFNNCAYIDVYDLLVQACGYGFQGTFIQPGYAFGGSARFRSHHINFTDCKSLQNGLDGFNVDQGAYAIKYDNCLAWMNGDGGFTIAGDNTSTGRPGEGEASRDIDVIDCESYNNWSSGLTFETADSNVTISRGRFYNNGRSSGTRAIGLSINAGIYVGQFSLGFNIQTKCYDDRQLCPVTANASGVLTATGWVAGTMGNYPRVSLYNASFVFQGYGTITAESAGSVTIATTAFNGVTVSSIAAGWSVTQRVQQNGLMIDIGAQGVFDIDGFGHLSGATTGQYGFKAVTYVGTNNGQNVINKGNFSKSVELLTNPSWETGIASGWTYSGTGSQALYTTAGANLHSAGCLQMVSSSGTPVIATAATISNYPQDGWFEAYCLITNILPGYASLTVTTATGQQTTVNHPGGGTKRLKIGGYLPAGNNIILSMQVTGNGTAYFDEASVTMKFEDFDNRDYSYPTRNLPT